MEAGGGEKPPALPTALPVEERAQAPAADNDYGDEFDDQEQLNAEIAEVMRLAEEEYAARMAAAAEKAAGEKRELSLIHI